MWPNKSTRWFISKSRYLSWTGPHLGFQPHSWPDGKLLPSLPGEEILKYTVSLASPLWRSGRPSAGRPRPWGLAHHRSFAEDSLRKSFDSNDHEWLSGFPPYLGSTLVAVTTQQLLKAAVYRRTPAEPLWKLNYCRACQHSSLASSVESVATPAALQAGAQHRSVVPALWVRDDLHLPQVLSPHPEAEHAY